MNTKRNHLFAFASVILLATICMLPGQLDAEAQEQKQNDQGIGNLNDLIGRPYNEMAIVVQRDGADQGNLTRFYNISTSPTRFSRLQRFYGDWITALQKVDAAKLSKPAQTDLETLKKRVARDLRRWKARPRHRRRSPSSSRSRQSWSQCWSLTKKWTRWKP